MKNGIVNELIIAMKERIPKGQNLANSLADILYMGKEAVYRRLRGEVAFTIDEVALLSKKLGISIDQIIGNHLSNRVTFDMNLLNSPNTLDSYYEIINRYQQIFDYVKGDNTTEVYTASNLLPFTLYSSFEHMSKFRLCRWIYQNGQMKTPNSLAEMQVDPKQQHIPFIHQGNQVLCQSESDHRRRCSTPERRAIPVACNHGNTFYQGRVQ